MEKQTGINEGDLHEKWLKQVAEEVGKAAFGMVRPMVADGLTMDRCEDLLLEALAIVLSGCAVARRIKADAQTAAVAEELVSRIEMTVVEFITEYDRSRQGAESDAE